MTQDQKLAFIKQLADELISTAIAHGVVVTIEQRACEPLAMGHHASVASVRAARANPHIFGAPAKC